MQHIKLDSWQTVMVAILVLFLGRELNRRFRFLNRYNIPEPVSAGVIVSSVITLYFLVTGSIISFDLFLRDVLLVVFLPVWDCRPVLPSCLKVADPSSSCWYCQPY